MPMTMHDVAVAVVGNEAETWAGVPAVDLVSDAGEAATRHGRVRLRNAARIFSTSRSRLALSSAI